MDDKVRSTSEYKNISVEAATRSLEASITGLTEFEVGKRLEKFGYNEIVEKKKNPFLEFLLRYWGPMPWLLELAMGLSFVLKHDLEGYHHFCSSDGQCRHRSSALTGFAKGRRAS